MSVLMGIQGGIQKKSYRPHVRSGAGYDIPGFYGRNEGGLGKPDVGTPVFLRFFLASAGGVTVHVSCFFCLRAGEGGRA